MTASAVEVAGTVSDPEMPMVTLADLGILRDVREDDDGGVTVTITPTYSGCPAMAEIRADLARVLREAGFARVDVRTVLSPPWTTDWISAEGRAKLTAAGIAPPGRVRPPGDLNAAGEPAATGDLGPAGAVPPSGARPVPLMLGIPVRAVACPRCGASGTERIAAFSATACKELRRCPACREPFEHVKEI